MRSSQHLVLPLHLMQKGESEMQVQQYVHGLEAAAYAEILQVLRMSTSESVRATREQTAMANFSPTHARTPPPKGTQASAFTAAASGVPSMNLSGMNSSGACSTAKHHPLSWSDGPEPCCCFSMASRHNVALPPRSRLSDMHEHAACLQLLPVLC